MRRRPAGSARHSRNYGTALEQASPPWYIPGPAKRHMAGDPGAHPLRRGRLYDN